MGHPTHISTRLLDYWICRRFRAPFMLILVPSRLLRGPNKSSALSPRPFALPLVTVASFPLSGSSSSFSLSSSFSGTTKCAPSVCVCVFERERKEERCKMITRVEERAWHVWMFTYMCVLHVYVCVRVQCTYMCMYVRMSHLYGWFYISGCLYIYVNYACMHVHCMYVNIYIGICLYMFEYMYVRMYVCMYVYMHVYMYIYVYVCMYICMYICAEYMYVCTRQRASRAEQQEIVYIYLYIYIYIYICIYIYVYI